MLRLLRLCFLCMKLCKEMIRKLMKETKHMKLLVKIKRFLKVLGDIAVYFKLISFKRPVLGCLAVNNIIVVVL